MKLVLIGYMGSGKSLAGKQLSKSLKFNFIDLDNEIESDEKDSIKNIFSQKGEIYFRKKEAEITYKLINSEEDFVLALGGGTPCYGSMMVDLISTEGLMTIYLKTSHESLTNRLFPEIESRPLISHLQTKSELNDFVRKHLFERSVYYNRAEMIIDIGEVTVDKVVENIVAQLY
jgi:shikimate kinase